MPTQLVDLDFSSLAKLDDARIDKLLRYHLNRASYDCQQRPGDKTARKVTLEISIKPVIDHDTLECSEVRVEIECKSKVPVHRSKPYEMLVNQRGFAFNQDFPDDLDQPSLYPRVEDNDE